ncbi:MAG: CPBP family intramembrane glutamic endopeptidase [Gemmatimonadales bacterium]
MASAYYLESRSPRYAILFAAPLLAAYEVVAWALTPSSGAAVRNGADVMLKSPFVHLLGPRGAIAFDAVLVAVGVALVARDWRRHPGRLRGRVFAVMLVESLALAVLVGVVLRYATATMLHFFSLAIPPALGVPTQVMVSLGAGIYEELLFRVILVGAMSWCALRLLRMTPRGATVFAVITSAVIFSAFHYVGVYGDTLQLSSFVFRMLAGIVFSVLYVTRGFGITAWTHTIYDLLVTLAGVG